MVFATAFLAVALSFGYLPIDVPSLRVPVWQLVFFVVLAIITEKATIRVSRSSQVTPSLIAYFLAAVVLGPLPALAVALLAQLIHLRRGEWSRSVYFATTAALQVGFTGLIYWAFLDHLGNSSTVTVIAGATAGIAYQLINYLLCVPIGILRTGYRPRKLWEEGVQPFLPYHLFFLAVSLGLVWIFQNSDSLIAFFLLLLPVLGLIFSFRAYSRLHTQAQENERLALRNERLAMQAIAALVNTLDAKDNYTSRHSAAVAQWATELASDMGLSAHEVELTHLAGLMHDVGKIGIPDRVLRGEGSLDETDRVLINTHPQKGADILGDIDDFREVARVVLYHHERYDGAGYPFGVGGEEIPLLSRIIGVADSYSAMMSDRPYRPRLPLQAARAELEKYRGTQFDPAVVERFLALLDRHEESYQRGEQADFKLEFQKIKFMRELPAEDEEGAAALEGAAAGANAGA